MKITEHEMLVTLANMALRMDDLTGHDVIEALKSLGYGDVVLEARKNSDRSTPRDPTFTVQDVELILKNMGHDVECGRCMGVAFTGSGVHGGEHTCKQQEHPVRRAARVLAEWAFSDSRLKLSQEPLREFLMEESVAAGYVPNDEQCASFITGGDTGEIPAKLAQDFPKLHAYLQDFWS